MKMGKNHIGENVTEKNISGKADTWTGLSVRHPQTSGNAEGSEIMEDAVLWDDASCETCIYRRFGETSVLTRTTWRHIPQDSIINSHLCENVNSYKKYNVDDAGICLN
jgi:hypothetical protein